MFCHFGHRYAASESPFSQEANVCILAQVPRARLSCEYFICIRSPKIRGSRYLILKGSGPMQEPQRMRSSSPTSCEVSGLPGTNQEEQSSLSRRHVLEGRDLGDLHDQRWPAVLWPAAGTTPKRGMVPARACQIGPSCAPRQARLFSSILFYLFEASGSSTSQWCARNLLPAETKA